MSETKLKICGMSVKKWESKAPERIKQAADYLRSLPDGKGTGWYVVKAVLLMKPMVPSGSDLDKMLRRMEKLEPDLKLARLKQIDGSMHRSDGLHLIETLYRIWCMSWLNIDYRHADFMREYFVFSHQDGANYLEYLTGLDEQQRNESLLVSYQKAIMIPPPIVIKHYPHLAYKWRGSIDQYNNAVRAAIEMNIRAKYEENRNEDI